MRNAKTHGKARRPGDGMIQSSATKEVSGTKGHGAAMKAGNQFIADAPKGKTFAKKMPSEGREKGTWGGQYSKP